MKRWMLRLLGVLCLAPAVSSFGVTGQPKLALDRISGLSITGAVGSVYTIQISTNLADANGWRPLNIVSLASTNKASIPFSLLPKGAAGYYRAVLGAPATPASMVLIKPGAFTLGSSATEFGRFSDEGPQTIVSLTKTIFMAVHPVTQGEYQSVTGVNPSSFSGSANLPIEQVSWIDATNYCGLLTLRERTAGHIPALWHYRLPTEAEWEYACRAGTTNRFYYGDDPTYSNLTNNAWYADNSDDLTHPVGLKSANPWGLYDMAGNVWEWCLDWYAPYPGGNVSDPLATDSTSGFRVLRGGSWIDSERFLRSACRIGDLPFANYFSFYGFRVVLAPED
jgi:formylglycine-generating enzyme required for sulfatase activity